MGLLYDIIIAPLVVGYQFIYALCTDRVGYGYGLLLLSLVTTLLLTPLRRLVAATQEDERTLQRVLDPQLADIKAKLAGGERHRAIQRLYRRYGYHPFLSIRAFYGLLLQVPFIFAAYDMLRAHRGLESVRFWGIADLAAPDRLLPGGINLLPLLMTAVNIVAALLEPGALRKDKIQAFVLAFLFLALLYTAPSAMLIYWTCNNAFSLLSAVWRRWKPSLPAKDDATDVVAVGDYAATCGGAVGGVWMCVAMAVLAGVGIFWFEAEFHKISNITMNRVYVVSFDATDWALAGLLVLAAVVGMRGIAVTTGWRRLGRCLAVVFCLALAGGLAWYCLRVGELTLRKRGHLGFYGGLYVIGLLVGVWLLLQPFRRGAVAFLAAAVRGIGPLFYWPSVLTLLLLVFVFAPATLYLSSPDMYGTVTARDILRSFLPYLLCLVYVAFYLWKVLPERWRDIVGSVFALAAVAALFFGLAMPPDGIFDADNFIPAVKHSDLFVKTVDAAVAATTVLLLLTVWRAGVARPVRGLLCVFALALALFGFYSAWQAPGGAAEGSMTEREEKECRDFFALSRTEPNIIVIMDDMFFGANVGRALQEYPDLAGRLPGFLWYRDTINDGSSTIMSYPSMMGGPEYALLQQNARPEVSLLDEAINSYQELPVRFLDAGYEVGLFDINFTHVLREPLRKRVGDTPRLKDMPQPAFYPDLMREAFNASGRSAVAALSGYSAALSVFRVLPGLARQIALEKKYLFTSMRVHYYSERLFTNASSLFLLPRFVNADSERPTYKWINSNMSHFPWALAKESLSLAPDELLGSQSHLTDLHYYTDTHGLRLLAELCDVLRRDSLYDNTRIIFVSDHSSGRREFDVPFQKLSPEESVDVHANPYPVMLVKDFNATGPLAVSDAFMHSSDIPALVCRGLDTIAEPPLLPDTGPARVRYHSGGYGNYSRHEKNRWNVRSFEITGPLLDPDSWRLLPAE